MVRKAVLDDLALIENTYDEHFKYEIAHEVFTVFKKGVYPTRKDAENAIRAGNLYVYEENHDIAGSMIADRVQPPEYEGIVWGQTLGSHEVMVVHLLIVRPSVTGRGIASSLVKYTVELAKKHSCKALRLDTGRQNVPAVALYKKLGFQIVAAAAMKVGGTIEHDGHLFLEKIL